MDGSRLISADEAFARFIEGFEDAEGALKYEQAISEVPVKGLRSLLVDFGDLYDFDRSLAMELVQHPERTLGDFDKAAHSKLLHRDLAYARSLANLHVRFRNLPSDVPLRGIQSDHIGHLIQISGITVRASEVRPLIIKAMFKCSKCGETVSIIQEGQFLDWPGRCAGCQNRNLIIDTEGTEYINTQWLRVQERPEQLPPGQLPRSFRVLLRDDVVQTTNPGDRVRITGVIDALQQRRTDLALDMYMQANHVDLSARNQDLLEITPEDEEAIRELASDPWIHRRVLRSIAPSIYGHEAVKEAIMYLLFGGVPKEFPDVRIRGDINVLLIGDPSTGKSQLLQFAARTAPRGLYTTGRGSSAAGLTAAVIRDKDEGGFVLEAGALVLADMGVCCIDEIDKMRDEDRNAIHPALEQQIVAIAKGGINAELNARAANLAAANPTQGRYNRYLNVDQNINLPITLLSRYDLIFILEDRPEDAKDAMIADHILGLHMQQEPAAPPISLSLLRKYIAYSKRIRPAMPREVAERLKDFYLRMRKASAEGGEATAISIATRQLESLVRLAEARARVHLRAEVTVEDAEAVIALMRHSLEQVGVDVATGEIDVDILYSGKPRSLQVQLQKVLGVITEMERITEAVRDEDLFNTLLQDHQMSGADAAKLIGVLMRDGTIYSPRPGYYKRVR